MAADRQPDPVAAKDRGHVVRRFRLHFDAMVYSRELHERTGKRYAVELLSPRRDDGWGVVLYA